MGRWMRGALAVVGVVGVVAVLRGGGARWDKEAAIGWLDGVSHRLGFWAMPAYVALHTLTLSLCLPYAVFFEAAASLLFGFGPAVLCVFCAKILGASLSFWIGRLVLRMSSSSSKWARENKYFSVVSRGVARDGWRFVLLARFSPIPSYVINYALAATPVRFGVDFLLPTVIGCLPMILQNASIGSLAGAAAAAKTSNWSSYCFPLIGILSSLLISLRVKKYSSAIFDSPSPGPGPGPDTTTKLN